MAVTVQAGRFHQYRGALLLALALLVLWMCQSFLVAVVTGAIFSIVLQPWMYRIRNWRIGVAWRAMLVTMAFAVCFLLPICAIIFLGAEAALSKIQDVQAAGVDPSQLTSSKGVIEALGLQELIAKVESISPVNEAQLRQFVGRAAVAIGAWSAKALQNFLASIPGAAFNTIIILLTVFFLLIDGKRAARFIRENSIFGPQQTDTIFATVVSLCHSVLVASIAVGVVQAALIVLACIITGTPGAPLIGLVAFVCSFLPVLGTAPITIFLTASAFFSGDFFAGIVFLVSIFVVGISDNIVRPYVLKGGAELHPLVGFVAAFAALDTLGFFGVFIGPVVAGIFFTLLPMVMRSYARKSVQV